MSRLNALNAILHAAACDHAHVWGALNYNENPQDKAEELARLERELFASTTDLEAFIPRFSKLTEAVSRGIEQPEDETVRQEIQGLLQEGVVLRLSPAIQRFIDESNENHTKSWARWLQKKSLVPTRSSNAQEEDIPDQEVMDVYQALAQHAERGMQQTSMWQDFEPLMARFVEQFAAGSSYETLAALLD